VTILLPSLSKAKAKAKTAVCMSNMKQIGFAFMNYTSKNNGQIPINYEVSSGKERTWDDQLAAYDGREVPSANLDGWIPHSYNFDQYICPADETQKHAARHKRSYSISHGVKNPNASKKRGISHSSNSGGWSMKMMKISIPSDTIAVVEYHASNNKLGCNSGDAIRAESYQSKQMTENFWGHAMWKSNYLLLDASVRHINAEATFKGVRSIWGSANEVDTMWDSRR
jgi:hypothetical protein